MLPAGFTARRARPSDLAGWVAVCAAVDLAETGEVDCDEQIVLDDWARPRFDLERDAWVALNSAGELVGHCHAWEERPGEEVAVDAYVLTELASRLEGPLLDLAIADGERICAGFDEVAENPVDPQVCVYTIPSNVERAELIAERGFVHSRRFSRMRIDLALAPLGGGASAPDIVVRTYQPDRDELTVAEVIVSSFADHYGWEGRTAEEWRTRFVGAPSYDPSLWSVAEIDGAVVGALIGRMHLDKGWVDNVGVVSSARGRGVGEALLREAFAMFVARGCAVVELGVDTGNATGALRLYEKVGMLAAFAIDAWKRPALRR